ncbi:hypothetical protein FH587_03830 (plasmid) [Leptospira interrogans]|uniref:hypothetical protein n=1 Tax=Leptospira interrogans TaxID=173 RepID=UPI001F086B94|nr:hypothetical protein [Leptospira interrogans]UML83146.1 hypothetical protein FH587_03830 [Leptospira interrogans]
MKLRILNILIWNLFVFWILNCSIGTQRDTCRYNLKAKDIFGPSDDSCEFLQTTAALPLPSNAEEDIIQSRTTRITFLLLNCYQYYQKLKECDKEENRYIPSIYSKE